MNYRIKLTLRYWKTSEMNLKVSDQSANLSAVSPDLIFMMHVTDPTNYKINQSLK